MHGLLPPRTSRRLVWPAGGHILWSVLKRSFQQSVHVLRSEACRASSWVCLRFSRQQIQREVKPHACRACFVEVYCNGNCVCRMIYKKIFAGWRLSWRGSFSGCHFLPFWCVLMYDLPRDSIEEYEMLTDSWRVCNFYWTSHCDIVQGQSAVLRLSKCQCNFSGYQLKSDLAVEADSCAMRAWWRVCFISDIDLLPSHWNLRYRGLPSEPQLVCISWRETRNRRDSRSACVKNLTERKSKCTHWLSYTDTCRFFSLGIHY